MNNELLIAFTVVFALDSLSPGPAVAAVVARGAASGLGRTMPFIAGLVLGDLVLFLVLFAAAVAGLAVLAAAMAPVFAIVKWAGVLYLLHLAYRLWTAPASYAPPVRGDAQRGDRLLSGARARRRLDRVSSLAMPGAAGALAARS